MVDGRIVAGRLVRLAGQRHLDDLERGGDRGLKFDVGAAQHAIDFFREFLVLPDGEHAGEPFALLPYGEFIVGSLFGWMGADNHRRFRTGFVEMGKGSVKTGIAAGVGHYALVADGARNAQIFCAAVTRDQAGILFADAKRIPGPALRSHLEILEHNIAHPASGSFLRPVSSEGRSLDGKRVHLALIDEIHEHPNAVVVDKMRAGTKADRDALILEITNSGYDRHSVCWAHHEYSRKILEGLIPETDADSWFAFVCQLDPCEQCRAEGQEQPSETCPDCDDWTDERVWLKTNPALPHTPGLKYLREQVAEARGMPSKANIVKRLNFCIWTESVTRWIPADAWAQCAAPLAPLRGRRGILGLDLASTTDLVALVGVFPDDDAPDPEPAEEAADAVVVPRMVDVYAHFFVPRETMLGRIKRDRVPYDAWEAAGILTTTEGNVIDDAVIERFILDLPEREGVEIAELGYDPWSATSLVTRLMAGGVTCVPIRQGFGSLSAPSKALEKLVGRRAIRHGGNPALAWCVGNAVVEYDAAGNIKPSKRKSTERIDGVVALVTALARVIVGGSTAMSYYETHEFRSA